MRTTIVGTGCIAGTLILVCLCTSPSGPRVIIGHAGSVSFENGSYQSCVVPMVITVVDSDLSGPAVPVIVKSTADRKGITLSLGKVPGEPWTYSDSVFFSIVKSDSAKHAIKVLDGDIVSTYYADASSRVVDSAWTTWTGVVGFVQPGGSPVIGVLNKLTINVWDSDVTDSMVFVSVSSKRDATGFNAPLRAVAGSAGSFFGQIGFSLKETQGDSVLAVRGTTDDTISIKYHDLTPAQDIMGSVCIWEPFPAAISLDSTAYHGTAVRMSIDLRDDDIIDSTVVVTVRSKMDTTGIKDTLHAAGGAIRYFVGRVGFTIAASTAESIAVQNGDSVVVSYQDDSPVELVTQSALWNSK
jgi:hypothetical protein